MVEGSRTELELLNAFAGESMARNRYTFFAKIAKKEGYEKISEVFLCAADNEKAHAKLFLKEIPKGIRKVCADYPFEYGNTKENLKSAIDGEREEWENNYKNSAIIAKEEGYNDIADLFTRIIEVEKHHSYMFSELLRLIDENKMFKRDDETQWHCKNCGYILIDKNAPNKCPLCEHPQGYFEVFCGKL